MTKALVVGGGITGLATAIVLSRQGIEVDLAERLAEIRALGSGISLIGAALRALDRLGLYEECAASGYCITDMENYEVDGTLLNRSPLPSPLGTDQPGMLGMMRPTLHAILLDHAVREGATLVAATSPTGIEQQPGGAAVTFSTGERRAYDLVVGADGLRSTVRDLILGPLRPDFRGTGRLPGDRAAARGGDRGRPVPQLGRRFRGVHAHGGGPDVHVLPVPGR